MRVSRYLFVLFSYFFLIFSILNSSNSVGLHYADEIISGNFTGNYTFNDIVNITSSNTGLYFSDNGRVYGDGTNLVIDTQTYGGILAISGTQRPVTDDTYDLGSSSFRWNQLYVGSGTSTLQGNVGIGLTSPSTKLHINGTTYTTDVIISNKLSCGSLYTDGSGNVLCGNASGTGSGNVSSTGGIANYLVKFGSDGSNITNSVIYDNGTAIGIGTTSPSGKLEVNGTICITGDNCISGWDSVNGSDIWTTSGSNIYYNSGNVSIGTNNPNSTLHLYDSNPKLLIQHNVADSGEVGVEFKTHTWENITKSAIIANATGGWGRSDLHFIVDTATDVNKYTLGTDTKMIINGTNGYVGIGTTSPATTLDVGGIIRSSQTANSIIFHGYDTDNSANTFQIKQGSAAGGSTVALQTINTNALTIETGGSERFRIDTSGNVGIGTTSPDIVFEVESSSSGAVTDALLLSNPNGASVNTGVALHLNPNGAGTARTASIKSRQTTSGNFADLGFFTAPGDTPAERMTITTAGNVGIGTTSPTGILDVNGTICISADCISSWDSVNGSGVWSTSGSNIYYNSGNVSIGTSSSVSPLHVDLGSVNNDRGVYITSSGTEAGIRLDNTATDGDEWQILSTGSGAGAGSGKFQIYNRDTTTTGFVIESDGDVALGTTTSDQKLRVDDADEAVAYFRSTDSTGGIFFGDNTGTSGLFGSNGNTWFTTGGATASSSALMYIESGGDIGIGTISPQSVLDIAHANTAASEYGSLRIGVTDTALGEYFSIGRRAATGDLIFTQHQNNVGGFIFASNSSGSVDDRFTLTNDGKIGIGTTSPAQNLHINSSGTNDELLRLSSSNGNSIGFYQGTSLVHNLNSYYDSTWKFGIRDDFAGGEALTIARAGGGGAGAYVGINNTDPQGTLDVNGSICISNDCISSWSSVNGSGVWSTSGSNVYRSSGSVGIGVSTPNESLHIMGSNPRLLVQNNIADQGTAGIELKTHTWTTLTKNAIVSNATGGWGKGDLHFVVDTVSDVNPYTLGTDTKMFIDGETGYIGIGTTSPSSSLHLLPISGSTSGLKVQSQISGMGASLNVSDTLHGSGILTQFTGDSDGDAGGPNNVVITKDGDVGIGLTSPAVGLELHGDADLAGAHGTPLHLERSSTTYENWIGYATGGTSDWLLGMDNGNSNFELWRNNGGWTETFQIAKSTGTLTIGSGSEYTVGADSWDPTFIVDATQGQLIHRSSDDTWGAGLQLGKTRTTGSVVQNGDAYGGVYFVGNDGTDLLNYGAAIESRVDGTPGTDDTPGNLIFKTTADGSNTLTERVRIDDLGNVGIGATDPGAKLVVNGNSGSDTVQIRNTVGAGYIYSYSTAATSGSIGVWDGVSAGLPLLINPAGGNVGIGISDPQTRLDIIGNSDSTAALKIGPNANFGWHFFDRSTDGDLQIQREVSDVFSDVMYFQRSSGNVGIGSTSPTHSLEVPGNVSLNNTIIVDGSGSVTITLS